MPDAFAQLEDQDIDSRVVLDYTSRDFTAIRSQLVGLARGLMPEWETAGEASDMGTLLHGDLRLHGRRDALLHRPHGVGGVPRLGHPPAVGAVHRQHARLHPDRSAVGVGDAGVRHRRQRHREGDDPGGHPSPQRSEQRRRPHRLRNGPRGRARSDGGPQDPRRHRLRHRGHRPARPPARCLLWLTEHRVRDPRQGRRLRLHLDQVSREGGQLVEWTYIANLSLARPDAAAVHHLPRRPGSDARRVR